MAVEANLMAKAAPLVAKLASNFAAPAKGAAIRVKEGLEVKFRKGFSRFIEENLTRFSTVKTIISSNTPIPFSTLYVNLWLEHSNGRVRDEDLLENIEAQKNVIFTATAGSGKSMLMRYLYLRFLEIQTERLPIFIELRELNEYPNISLYEYVRSKISDYIEGFSEYQLRYALESGRIILFLDGFDEVDYDRRNERELQINELASRFKNLWMFVSSRPAETFASWQKFHVYAVSPLSKIQVEHLINNIPYDDDAKRTFRRKLSEGLFESHNQFLTNPLLTIMMLITIEQFAEVPAKVHLFYEYAFEALFGRHDATKAGFQRKRHTSLPLDDFKRLFAYFCMMTYARQIKTFSSDQTLDFIQRAISSSQINVDKALFRRDLIESTCMLVLDGLEYTFSHRSFQEYFSAYFLSRVKVDEFSTIMPKLLSRAVSDKVISMVAEMNKEKFEESWALPFLKQICARTTKIDVEKDCIAFDGAIFDCRSAGLSVLFTYDNAGRNLARFLFTITRSDATEEEAAKRNYATNGRYALYEIYRVFDAIHKRIEDGTRDFEILKQIVAGDLLGDDPRFASWRKQGITKELNEFPFVKLTSKDHVWFSKTHWGRFLRAESELLPELLKQFEHRVEERRKGLASIFSEE